MMIFEKKAAFPSVMAYASAAILGAAIALFTAPNPSATASFSAQTGLDNGQVISLTQAGAPRLNAKNNVPDKSADLPATTPCLGDCVKISEQLIKAEIIDDESFESLYGNMQALAAHLETDYFARMDMLKVVMSTDDGNRRALIINAFTLLPQAQREELGRALLKSENWRARLDGTNLSISPESLTPQTAKGLFGVISNERHPVVKTSIINAMQNAASLKGNKAALENLSNILSTETDSSVRSAAMLTKLSLHKAPHDALPDTFMALGSGDVELQQSAFIALEQIYAANSLVDGGLDRIDHDAVKRALDEFMDIEITAENEKSMGRLLSESDNFYERHLGGAQ